MYLTHAALDVERQHMRAHPPRERATTMRPFWDAHTCPLRTCTRIGGDDCTYDVSPFHDIIDKSPSPPKRLVA
eukprot:2319348-Pleurochrysis_carterae.AAC.1